MDVGYESFIAWLELHNPDLNRNQRFFFYLIFSRIIDIFKVPIRILLDWKNYSNFFRILMIRIQGKVRRYPCQTVSDSSVPP